MKRNTALFLLLPVAVALASCGMTAQYSYQRYNDGIYNYASSRSQAQDVVLYSVEDFEAMAAANIAQKRQQEAKDTVYVLVDDGSDVNFTFALSPFLFWDPFLSPWYLPDPWEYRIWYNNYRWYDPWFYGHSWAFDPWYHHYWYDPWYYGGWYDPWYHPWYDGPWHVGPRPPKPGLSHDGYRYYGDRHFTQSPGNRTNVPGTGSNRRNPTSLSRPGNFDFGSGGSSLLKPSTGSPSRGQSGVTVPSGNSSGSSSTTVRSRYSNRQSSPSVNVMGGSGTRTNGGYTRSNPGSTSRGGTGTVRSGYNTRSTTRSSSSSSYMRNSSPARSSSTPSTVRSYSSGRSGGSFSGGSSGGGARRR